MTDPAGEPGVSAVTDRPGGPRIVVLEHDPSDPALLLGDWLAEAGAELTVLRPYSGDGVPADLRDVDALVSMGGDMGAHDDDVAPWLPDARRLLGAAAAAGIPTLGVCLGAQLLAVATGGRVVPGSDGPEIGAYLTAKRDAAETDPLFAELPLSPDVMQFHYDVISELPPGAVLLLSSIGYPNQAFRVGSAAWGIQFHIETPARVLRGWGGLGEGGEPDGAGTGAAGVPAVRTAVPSTPRCGPALDQAEELMGQVWRAFAHRFVELARRGVPANPTDGGGPRLPLLPGGAFRPDGADVGEASGAMGASGAVGASGPRSSPGAGHATGPAGTPGAAR